ncbi:MAG: hypothetical protein K1X61_15890 [Chitinophagales bacterium]|nr:hypothetical protein [Chitinophagales bacterium]
MKHILISCFGFVLFGCNNSTQIKTNATGKKLFDSIEVMQRCDSIFYHAGMLSDTAYCIREIRYFNNEDLANQYPQMVGLAYSSALVATQSVPCDLNGNNYTANVLRQIEILADVTANKRVKTWAKYLRARYYCDIDEYLIALPDMLTVYSEFEQQNDSLGQCITSKRIGNIYMGSYNDYDKAIVYFKKALERSNETEKSKNIVNLFMCYHALQNADSLNYYYHWFMDRYPFLFSEIDFIKVNTLYQIYLYDKTQNGNIDSVSYYMKLLNGPSLGNTIDGNDLRLSTISYYVNVLLEKREYARAKAALREGLRIDTTCGYVCTSRVDLYKSRYKYYAATGDFTKAYTSLNIYNEEVARINFAETKAKIEQMKVQFENEEDELKRMKAQEQKDAVAQQEIKNQKIIRNALIFGAALLMALIGVLISRFRLKRKMEMELIRNRLSRDLHDDIGSTLSSINILSRTVQKNIAASGDEKTKASLEKINERSQRLLDSMSDIIWNINPGNDTMEEVMSRMREYATTILEAKNIDYVFDFPDEKSTMKLSMDVKNNLYLIFKEAVNNLSKYSACTKACVSLTFDEKNICLKITDNGKGFNQQEIIHRGGLINMQHRAEEIKGILRIISESGKGTSIELMMPRY